MQLPYWPALVQCRYEPDADGMINVLSRILLAETVVRPGPGAAALDIRRITWRAVVQVNRLETLFSADWETVGQSRRRTVDPGNGDEIVFSWASVPYTDLPVGVTLVARVAITVEWLGPGRTILGKLEIVAPTYSSGGTAVAEGCYTLSELPR